MTFLLNTTIFHKTPKPPVNYHRSIKLENWQKNTKTTVNLIILLSTVTKRSITICSCILYSDPKQIKTHKLPTNKYYLNSNSVNHEWTKTTCSSFNSV